MTQPQPYVPTAREQKFLESVEDTRYEREIISGLGPFFHEKAPADMLSFYSGRGGTPASAQGHGS